MADNQNKSIIYGLVFTVFALILGIAWDIYRDTQKESLQPSAELESFITIERVVAPTIELLEKANASFIARAEWVVREVLNKSNTLFEQKKFNALVKTIPSYIGASTGSSLSDFTNRINIKITNRGDRVATNVVIFVNKTFVTTISIDPEDRPFTQNEDKISIGDMIPGQEVSLAIWADHTYSFRDLLEGQYIISSDVGPAKETRLTNKFVQKDELGFNSPLDDLVFWLFMASPILVFLILFSWVGIKYQIILTRKTKKEALDKFNKDWKKFKEKGSL